MGRTVDVPIDSIEQVHTPVMDEKGNITIEIRTIKTERKEEEKGNGEKHS